MRDISFQLPEAGVVVLKQFNAKYLGYSYIAAAAVIWGSNGVIVNRVPFDSYAIAFVRVLFASIALLPLVLITKKSEMVRAVRSWKLMLALGVLLALGWVLIFSSMKLIAIANAVLLNYTAPIFVGLLAPLFLKEKLEKSTLLALAIAATGIVVIAYSQGLQTGGLNFLGVTLGLLAGLAYAAYMIVSKRALFSFSSQTVAFYSYLVATLVLIPFVLGAKLSASSTSWVLLLVLGIFNTALAVTLYLKGMAMVKAQKGVVFTYLEPVSAVVFGFLFLAQPPTLLMLAGGFCILIGGYIAASK
jgi:drug/metabolite transporter (DMT)-like permease